MSRFGMRSKARPKEAIPEVEAEVVNEKSRPYGFDDLLAYADGDDKGPTQCQVQVSYHTVMNWGGRHDNEDRIMSASDYYRPHNQGLNFYTFGVMDGHDTEQASETVSRILPGVLNKILKAGTPMVEACTKAMWDCEEQLKKLHSTSGTCVLANIVTGRYVWTSNLGDCRCALIPLQLPENGKSVPVPKVSRLVWMSRDQKAGLPEERARIHAAGGNVIDGRVEGLEPSRTLGDFDVKMHVAKNVISIVPEVRRAEIGDGKSPAQAIMVCGTDGVWDVISGQDICDLIHARKEIGKLQAAMLAETKITSLQPLKDLAEDLVQFAIARGSKDDCTAVVALVAVNPTR